MFSIFQITDLIIENMLPLSVVESQAFSELINLIPGHNRNSMTRKKATKRIETKYVKLCWYLTISAINYLFINKVNLL